jgi:hypothetical protein
MSDVFSHDVLVDSSVQTIKTLKRLKLVAGIDFTPKKGAVAAGRPNQVMLAFKDRDTAILFKLQVGK